MSVQYVTLYLDHPKVGCGYRRFLVLKVGRKEVRLLCVESAESLKVPVADLKFAKPEAFKPRRLAKRISNTARTYNRRDSWAVKEGLALLRAEVA